MANDITSNDFVGRSTAVLDDEQAALQAAHAQAVAEINAIREKVILDQKAGQHYENYSMHDAPGFGRYVIPRRTGWKELLKIIHDPVPNIDFSANVYPAFDGVIGEHFQSPYLLDPLNDKYEARSFISTHPGRKPWEDLRDNIAAVRNFLLQHYYANEQDGVSREKARKALNEIAGFVGDGLYNNWLFLGILPNHNPTKPFISISAAQAPDGKGAQYLYEKILEHQRHSNWMRPFEAVKVLFGGKASPDWQLPPASDTHFTDWNSKDIVSAAEAAAAGAPLAEAEQNLAKIDNRLADIQAAKALSVTAGDLDAIGNHLVYTATNMGGIAQMNDGVRRDAVEIAKDILRKLKISIGDKSVIDGLQMKPSDDLAALGAIKGVAMVYERLVAWARANNDSEIFQHPAVIAATQAIGQLGYQAKAEALRMATLAGNHELAKNIGEQMARLPESYRPQPGQNFGNLLDAVESGIDTIIYRTQQVGVSGAKIGKSVDNLGTSMDAPPTAGNMLQEQDIANQRNVQLLAAQQLAQMAQAQRNSAPAASVQAPKAASTAQAPVAGQQGMQRSTVGRAQPRQANVTSSRTATVAINGMMTPAQLAAARNATMNALHHAHEADEHTHHEQVQRQLLLASQKLAQQTIAKAQAKAKATVAKIDPSMLAGFQSATATKGLAGNGDPLKPGRRIDPQSILAGQQPSTKAYSSPKPASTAPVDTTAVQDDKNPYLPPQPPAPGRTTGGRGF